VQINAIHTDSISTSTDAFSMFFGLVWLDHRFGQSEGHSFIISNNIGVAMSEQEVNFSMDTDILFAIFVFDLS
jgi:hypothetical protein